MTKSDVAWQSDADIDSGWRLEKLTQHQNEQRERSRTQGGAKGRKTGKLETFGSARGKFLKVESMERAKCSVFQRQETLLARGSLPGSIFQAPETLFAGGSKVKKQKVSATATGRLGGSRKSFLRGPGAF